MSTTPRARPACRSWPARSGSPPGDETWEGSAGDYLVIPQHRHDLHADTDAAVLLTVATRA